MVRRQLVGREIVDGNNVGGGITSITGGGVTSWTQVINAGYYETIDLWYGVVGGSPTTSVTLNLGSAGRIAAKVMEWTGTLAADVKGSPLRVADQMIGVGETYDFEYRATSSGELTLVGLSPNDNRRAVQTLIVSGPRN